MNIYLEKTLWVFLLSNKDKPSDRHIEDIINGVVILKDKNVPNENIRIFIDNYKDKEIKITNYLLKVRKTSTLRNIIKKSKHKNIFIFIVGDGNVENGIYGYKPHILLKILNCNVNHPNIVVILTQCYAGVFKDIKESKHNNTVLIGATNLSYSFSCQLSTLSWNANLFLYNLFEWINNPIDVDGDKRNTVLDLYKFAVAKTNEHLCISKVLYPLRLIELLKEKQNLDERLKNEKSKITNENFDVSIQSNIRELNTILLKHYSHQEPWISNPELALKLKIK